MSNNKKQKKKWKTESVTPLALSNDRIVKKLRIYVARLPLPFAVCRLSFIVHRLSDYKAAQISDLMTMSGMSNSI